MHECNNLGINAQTWAMREDHRFQQYYSKCQRTNFISFSIRDLELTIVSGVEARMSKSDIKISKCYMGFLTPLSKVFPQPEPVRNIF